MKLYDLENRPVTFAELVRRAEAYWATHDRDGNVLPRYSSDCANNAHRMCNGRKHNVGPCTCPCHQEAKAAA